MLTPGITGRNLAILLSAINLSENEGNSAMMTILDVTRLSDCNDSQKD